jgi:hypothetical protein
MQEFAARVLEIIAAQEPLDTEARTQLQTDVATSCKEARVHLDPIILSVARRGQSD